MKQDRSLHAAAGGLDFVPIAKEFSHVKQIIAIVKPYLAEKVLDTLSRAPLEALNVREVKGFGRQKNYLDEYSESEYSKTFLPKIEISMWLDDSRVEETVRKIVAVARSGRMGDGKIFVLPMTFHADMIDFAEYEARQNQKEN
ncbi:P-II family nitrogen regulator [Bremerella cremea]|uniref:P-II family nitrogen regulator n=1 Tax=Bremerella cremea TaxID=1031537 RepID=UPI0031EDBECB